MFFKSILHRYKRFRQLGVRKSTRIIYHKILRKFFYKRWKSLAIKRRAHHSWAAITKKHGIHISFAEYWQKKTAIKLLPLSIDAKNNIISRADAYTRSEFSILGSGLQQIIPLNWHQDSRLKVQNPQAPYHFDATSFYQDISIENGSVNIIKDIKVPWELSRCQHLPILGLAYQETSIPLYADTFVQHICSWLEHNPYLLGINWLCPMEVAIRAINWIWAWQYLKENSTISLQFWEQFTSALYDHMHYLENNWEIFDTKTSNHYLADLLGYFYLCWFFQDLPTISLKRDWCIKELLKEFERQVFEEGTDYESTTAYHCLVTEIFDHVALLCREMNIKLPAQFHEKLSRMHEFIQWSTINKHELIKIGDDDSGKIIALTLADSAFLKESEKKEKIKHFPSFGLSILKTDKWHITLRHHAYNQQQPSAHFHNDSLSITLAVQDIPVIIDPGSYVYTASSNWRNQFRSVTMHNTFFIQNHEPVSFDNRLFALTIPENTYNPHTLSSSHNLYERFGVSLHRTVDWHDEKITISDSWHYSAPSDVILGWNFTLHPAIKVRPSTNNIWILSHDDKALLTLHSSLNFQASPTWISPEYGVKVPSISLQAQQKISWGQATNIILEKL